MDNRMEISSKTTAAEIAQAGLSPEELERAIIIFAKHRHKEARHKAIDILHQNSEGSAQTYWKYQKGGGYRELINSQLLTWDINSPHPFDKIQNIQFHNPKALENG